MKRMIVLCASILVCAGVMTACTSGGESNSNTASTQETTAVTTAAKEVISETETTDTAPEEIKADENAIPDGTSVHFPCCSYPNFLSRSKSECCRKSTHAPATSSR